MVGADVRGEQPGRRSYLAGWEDVGQVFGLQRPEQMLVHVEETTSESTLTLRLPTAMRGRIYDATTGVVVGEVTVEAGDITGPPVPIALPPNRQAVILDLRAD